MRNLVFKLFALCILIAWSHNCVGLQDHHTSSQPSFIEHGEEVSILQKFPFLQQPINSLTLDSPDSQGYNGFLSPVLSNPENTHYQLAKDLVIGSDASNCNKNKRSTGRGCDFQRIKLYHDLHDDWGKKTWDPKHKAAHVKHVVGEDWEAQLKEKYKSRNKAPEGMKRRYYYDSDNNRVMAPEEQPVLAVRPKLSPRSCKLFKRDSNQGAHESLVPYNQESDEDLWKPPAFRQNSREIQSSFHATESPQPKKSNVFESPRPVAEVETDPDDGDELLPVGTIMFRIFGKRKDAELLYGPGCTANIIQKQLENGSRFDEIGRVGGKDGDPMCMKLGIDGKDGSLMVKMQAMVHNALKQNRERFKSQTKTTKSTQALLAELLHKQSTTSPSTTAMKQAHMEMLRAAILKSRLQQGPNYQFVRQLTHPTTIMATTPTVTAAETATQKSWYLSKENQEKLEKAAGGEKRILYAGDTVASLEHILLNADPIDPDSLLNPQTSSHTKRANVHHHQQVKASGPKTQAPYSFQDDEELNFDSFEAYPDVEAENKHIVKFIARGDAPYHALIHAGGRFACGGIILQRFWILTSANCALAPPEIYEIYAGRTSKDQHQPEEQKFEVLKIFVHENFSRTALGSDLALMLLDKPVHFNAYTSPAKLPVPHKEPMPGQTMILTGFGFNNLTTTELKATSAAYISDWECEFLLSSNNVNGSQKIADSQLCTLGPDHAADAGNPLVTENTRTLEGIVSYTIIGGQEPLPIVYTQVSHFMEWMTKKMSNVKI